MSEPKFIKVPIVDVGRIYYIYLNASLIESICMYGDRTLVKMSSDEDHMVNLTLDDFCKKLFAVVGKPTEF